MAQKQYCGHKVTLLLKVRIMIVHAIQYAMYMFSVRTFTSFKLRYYAHFWHYAGWQELAKVMLLQKRTPIVVWIVKPTMAAARLPLQCCLLALANQHSAKNGRNIEVWTRWKFAPKTCITGLSLSLSRLGALPTRLSNLSIASTSSSSLLTSRVRQGSVPHTHTNNTCNYCKRRKCHAFGIVWCV